MQGALLTFRYVPIHPDQRHNPYAGQAALFGHLTDYCRVRRFAFFDGAGRDLQPGLWKINVAKDKEFVTPDDISQRLLDHGNHIQTLETHTVPLENTSHTKMRDRRCQ